MGNEISNSMCKWNVIAGSVRGISHLMKGLPNQDALQWLVETKYGLSRVIVAISDGHGDKLCFRSAVGSEIAVKSFHKAADNLLRNISVDKQQAVKIKSIAENDLPRNVVWEWRASVSKHFLANPFLINEILDLWQSKGETDVYYVALSPAVAYGATLLAVLLTDEFLIYLQIGDGNVFEVTNGVISKPIPHDERLIANETTSLCSDNAVKDFRVVFKSITDSVPDMILLATDGYANSFPSDEILEKNVRNIFEWINDDGIEEVEKELKNTLEYISKNGSGDDVTMAIVVNKKENDMIENKLLEDREK